jgi:hypothetical protein
MRRGGVKFINGRNEIYKVLTPLLRECYQMDIDNQTDIRNELLQMISMCIKSLFRLETNEKDIEITIMRLAFEYFPGQPQKATWYVDQILPGLNNYTNLTLDDDSTYQSN